MIDLARLEKYAELIVKVGINLKEGQEVIISAELDCPDFVTLVVEKCYNAGAKKVTVEWTHSPVTKLAALNQNEDTLATVEKWQEEKFKFQVERLPAKIYLLSEDPDALVGIDQAKYSAALARRFKVIKPYRDAMDNKYQWCIAAVSGKAWAKKVFPDLSDTEAVEKLWEAILYTSRCTSDPIAAWGEHNADLKSRCKKLNELNIKNLHYTASNGTDLTVGLIPEANFLGGGEHTLSGNFFNPNIPSEEVFTSPKKGEAEGIVYSSRPLSYRGELIDNFNLTFKNGKVVEVHAEKNESLLKELVGMDEGSSYLGECALVPYSSPIRESGILFFNTLFDENAACHLALGEGFTNTIEGFENKTIEECRALGVNESQVHEDFMIGTKDLSITAETESGETVKIFENGNWAF